MSYFVACFGIPDESWAPKVSRFLRQQMTLSEIHELTMDGSTLIYGGVNRFCPVVHASDSQGWVLQQGVAVDVKSTIGRPQLREYLDCYLQSNQPDVDRYEGTFALAMWDAQRSTALFFNDHAATRNLYYCEHRGAVYVTTAPVALAYSLGLKLCEYGVRQFLTRGCVLAPTSLFAGMKRLSVGEHGRVCKGRLDVVCDWTAVQDPVTSSIDESANMIASAITDRIRRLSAAGRSSIADLTGGLDSRVLNLAREFARTDVDVTVNGPDSLPDVRIAHELAAKMGWPIVHFKNDAHEISREERHELSIRTAGELAFDRISIHRQTRPGLAVDYDMHLGGSGGEVMRYYAWSHEFQNIGRRQLADAERTVRYRYSHHGAPPAELFRDPWFGEFQQRLTDEIRMIFQSMPGTLTTQQQDALYIWKMTSHSSLWLSSTACWLPGLSPLLMRGCLDAMLAVPWRHKLTSQLQRRVNHFLSPRGSAVKTTYGISGGKLSLRDCGSVSIQTIRQAGKILQKVTRVLTNRDRKQDCFHSPFDGPEMRDFLNPANMTTADLYDPAGFERYCNVSDEQMNRRVVYLSRIATVEHIGQAIA